MLCSSGFGRSPTAIRPRLTEASGVTALLEQEFGIDMPLFLYLSRHADEERAFGLLDHPQTEALALPA